MYKETHWGTQKERPGKQRRNTGERGRCKRYLDVHALTDIVAFFVRQTLCQVDIL